MRIRFFPLAIAAIALFVPSAAHAAVVEVCNEGDAQLNVARALYSKSVLLGNSYEVSGWLQVDPQTCETIYSADDPDDVYLGFTYIDLKNVLRSWVSAPNDNSGAIKAVSEKFCVGVDKAFDYEIETRSASCQEGFAQLEFSVFIGTGGGNYGRITYTMKPDRADPTHPVFGVPPATGKMLVGGTVQFLGKTWQMPDSTEYLAPVAPKEQYAVDRAPVAQSIKQVKDTLAKVQPCSNNLLGTNVSNQAFTMDDRGVAVITNKFSDPLHVAGYTNLTAMIIGDMDLANAAVTNRGGCWELELLCKDHMGCVQKGEGPGAVGVLVWDAYTNTNQQAAILLNALKAIAPYYPDTTPEIRQNFAAEAPFVP